MDDGQRLSTFSLSRRQLLQAVLLAAFTGKVSLTEWVAAQEAVAGLKPAAFKALVEALSDMNDLSDELLETYFSTTHEIFGPLEALYRKARLEASEGEAVQADLTRLLQKNPTFREAAAALLLPWYTGVVDAGTADTRVVTYTGALAWQALAYTNAPTFCGGATGYWSSAPEGLSADG